MFFHKDDTPIVVVVKDGRWDAYSMNPTLTLHDHFLLNLIKQQGGINESVTDGTYLFNSTRKGVFKQEMTLIPYSA